MPRSTYLHEPSRSMLSLLAPQQAGDPWELAAIRVPVGARGHGHASRLLTQALGDLDAEGLDVILRVHPDPWPDALTYEQLVSWYERHGFRLVAHPDDQLGVRCHMRRAARTVAVIT